jgi:signal transduction histidine kinase
MLSHIAAADRQVRTALAATLACTVIALLVLLVALVTARRNSAQVNAESQSFAQIVSQVDALVLGVIDAETGQREYALTGRAEYLEPFAQGQASSRDAENALRASIRAQKAAGFSDPAIEAAVDMVIRKKAAVLASFSQNVERVRAGKARRAVAAVLTDEGKASMDDFRAAASDLRGRFAKRIETRSTVVARRKHVDTLIFSLIGVTVASVLLGGLVLRREADVLKRVGEDLSRANAQALAAKQRAEEADAAKTRFLAMASHDMRQPLHAITLYLASLKRRAETPKTREVLVNMERAAESLTRMFSGLLDMARIEAGVLKPQMTDVALAEIFNSLDSELSNDAEREWVQLRIMPTSLRIMTDPELMLSVLRNLLTNAIKYAPGGRILLGVRRVGGRARIEVHDEGPGIPEEKLVLMFGEFVRLERSNAAAKEGLGLGLSIASRLASLLGGDLQVSSQVGKGTRFWISAELASNAAGAPPRAPPAPRDLKGIRVAVLDDEPDSLDAMLRVIEDAGGVATGYGLADRYVEAMRGGACFDLVIADPVLHVQAQAALGGADTTPAIIVTGATDAGTLARLERAGAPWMVKPIPEDQLIAQAALHAAHAPG